MADIASQKGISLGKAGTPNGGSPAVSVTRGGHNSQSRPHEARATLCIVLPAYNEEAAIEDLLDGIPRKLPGISEIFVVVVDDGSDDRTSELARRHGALVVRHSRNRGIGAAFQTGVEKAIELNVDYMVNMDADGQFDPDDISRLLEPLLAGTAGCVIASRFIDKDYRPEMDWLKAASNRFMAKLISSLLRKKYCDVSCGFRAFTRDVLHQLDIFGDFSYAQETILDLSFRNVTIFELPVKVRPGPASGRSADGVGHIRYAWGTIKTVFRCFRDYKPIRVFGGLAAIMMAVAIAFGSFLLVHYVQTSNLSPHKWAGFTSGFFAALGVLIFVTGLLADMMARVRINQERILALLREHDHALHRGMAGESPRDPRPNDGPR